MSYTNVHVCSLYPEFTLWIKIVQSATRGLLFRWAYHVGMYSASHVFVKQEAALLTQHTCVHTPFVCIKGLLLYSCLVIFVFKQKKESKIICIRVPSNDSWAVGNVGAKKDHWEPWLTSCDPSSKPSCDPSSKPSCDPSSKPSCDPPS